MVNRVGLSCTQPLGLASARSASRHAVGFGNDDNGKDSTADKIAGVATRAEKEVLEPVAEGAVLIGATGAATTKVGNKLIDWFKKPIDHTSKVLGEFIANHVQNPESIIGKGLRKFKSLTKIITNKGPQAAEYLIKNIKTKANLAVKFFAGLLGFIFVGKEMPKFEKVASNTLHDLSSTALATTSAD